MDISSLRGSELATRYTNDNESGYVGLSSAVIVEYDSEMASSTVANIAK